MVGCWVTWWVGVSVILIVKSVGLHGRVLGCIVWSVGLYDGSVELHGVQYWITLWGVGVTWWRLLGYIVESVGLYDRSVELYGGECWVTWCGVGLNGGMLGYMVGCWVIQWVLFNSNMGSVGLHDGECW